MKNFQDTLKTFPPERRAEIEKAAEKKITKLIKDKAKKLKGKK